MASRPDVNAVARAVELESEELITDEIEFVSLPISVLGRGDRRLEGETYLTGGYGYRTQIEAALPFNRLSDIAEATQPYRLKGTLVDSEDGVPFLTATQVFDIRPVPRKWVAPSKTPDLDGRFVEPRVILMTCSGSVGDVIVSFGPHVGKVISHDLLRIRTSDPDLQGFIYMYLRTQQARMILRSSQYGSVVKHLEPEHVQAMPVPIVGEALREAMGEATDRVFELRNTAYRLTQEAEALYAAQFEAVKDLDVEGYVVAASALFSTRRRLDGFHYNPLAHMLEENLEAAAPTEMLSTLVDRIILPNRFKRVRVEEGTPFIDSEDIFKINPEVTKFIAPTSKDDLADYQVERGWLLVARSGQTYGLNGSVIIANAGHEGKVVSEHIIRIVPRGIRPGYLVMALGHPVFGRPLILRLTFGSSVPEIAPTDLATVKVPRLGDVEDEIANRIEGASGMRLEADKIEDAAVGRLEGELSASLPSEPTEFESFENLASKLFKLPKTES
jgi:hypothetical protein